MMQDSRVKRLLIVSVILLFICIICIFISVRYIEKYRNKVIEITSLEQKLDNYEQNIKKLGVKIKELETRRYDLSLEKEQISKDYSTIKDKYVSLGKTMKTLERDVNNLQIILKNIEENEDESDVADKEANEVNSRLKVLQSRNDKLLKELAAKTKEKMILKIAFEAQAKRLGLSDKYDPELKEILKKFVTSLQ